MIKHKQVKIDTEFFSEFKIKVDEGLEDIISNFFYWEIYTDNSCINNNGSVWISFEDFHMCNHFMKRALNNQILINGQGYVRETLYDYLEENSEFKLHFDKDINNELINSISLRFPTKDLKKFKDLFFEVFPPKIIKGKLKNA
jgi:hypothetical protein